MELINISKLPKYAQEEINSLRRQVDTLRRSLEEQKQSKPTRVQWGYEIMRDGAGGYLPDDEQVSFRIASGPNRHVRVRLTEYGLYINADTGISIQCESSNCFTVIERKR